MTKTLEQYFIDWENDAFGYGYGSGERPVLTALKQFMTFVTRGYGSLSYSYETLEEHLTPTVTWLLINRLCQLDILEYGTSPRFGWLTKQGEALKSFIDGQSVDELVELATSLDSDSDYVSCEPTHCNCDKGKCHNPFWRDWHDVV